MSNDLLRIISVSRLLILVALFLLLSGEAFADHRQNILPPTSLCAAKEIILFSCNIGVKKVSLCGTTGGVNSPLLVQYRFGQARGTPELKYPSEVSEVSSAFYFSTVENTSGFPLETISFDNPGASYDIMTPEESGYAQWAPFTGIGVTVRGKATKLLKCEKDTIIVNLAPLRKTLGLSKDAHLSDALPKYPLEKDLYPIIHKKRPCGSNCKCEIKYPDIADPVIADDINSFIKGNCKKGGGKDLRSITATVARKSYLTLSFSRYQYSQGAAHGYYIGEKIELFHKGSNGWEPFKKGQLLDLSPTCQTRINGLLYRQLKPQLSELTYPQALLDRAMITIGSQGLIFSYDPYDALEGNAGHPWPILLSYKMLDGCLRFDR
ncbi:MAG: hypothetical protein ABSD50_17490 [Smithella sp.]